MHGIESCKLTERSFRVRRDFSKDPDGSRIKAARGARLKVSLRGGKKEVDFRSIDPESNVIESGSG